MSEVSGDKGCSPENPSAFPYAAPLEFHAAETGMALRDWFAGQALVAFGTYPAHFTQRASDAYAQADAMLAERAKGGAK
jgi:hypothetical protein